MIAVDSTDLIQSVAWISGDYIRSFHGQIPDFSLHEALSQAQSSDLKSDILVNKGPGRLTSTRVGCGLAMGLAATDDRACWGIDKGLLLSFWCYLQQGQGTHEVLWSVDSKHMAMACYNWSCHQVQCIKPATLLAEVSEPTAFPAEQSATLMIDLYMHCRRIDALDILSDDPQPVYLRAAV